MTNSEIEQGEIISQNGIVNVLKQFGFTEGKDFIFLDENNISDKHGTSYVIASDGKPLYGLASEDRKGKKEPVVVQHYTENGIPKDRVQEIPVYSMGSKWDKDGHWKYGEMGSNNGVYGVYISGQGLILTENIEIPNLMRQEFRLKDSGLGIPVSNGTQFFDKSLQDKWRAVRNYMKNEKSQTNDKNHNANKQELFRRAVEQLKKKLQIEKMPVWAQEQLRKKHMDM